MIATLQSYQKTYYYGVFRRFRQVKFAYGGLILSSSQFLLRSQLHQKMKLASKVVRIDPNVVVSLPGVSGIVIFINKNIEPVIFLLSLTLTKQLSC